MSLKILSVLFTALLALPPLAARAQNVAQNKSVSASAAVASGKPVQNLNDGSFGTYTAPASTPTLGFHYDIDFGQESPLHYLAIVNYTSNPGRLTNYRLTLYADNLGSPGAVLWEADVRTDGTNSGAGGTDRVFAGASTNPAHVFRGRYLRLTNLSGAASNPQVAEIQAWIPGSGTNIARGRPVIASGATYSGYPATNIVDGGYVGSTTMSHPSTSASSPGFYYQVDLGAVYALNRIVLWNRSDCCNTRLTNYRVILYADNAGVPGAVNWQADIRTDGSDSGLGGSDTIPASASNNPAHLFSGRFIRVQFIGTATDQPRPQIAELEAFPEPPPTIRQFVTDAGNIGGPGLPTNATLSWSVQNADSVTISGLGTVAASGSTTVAPTSTTTYTLTATRNGFVSSTSTVTIAANATALAPKITEFQAAEGLLEDEDGERGDWIELYNPNPFTLVLTGYTLTDDPAAAAKWTFPLANLAPGGYLVVFADDKDRRVPGQPLHTNFALSSGGDHLALHAPGGALLQRFPASYPTSLKFPKQAQRATYGLDAAGTEKFFRPATPGAANAAGYDGVIEDTNFSVKRGIYSSAQTVAITTTTSGATIRYTTNGDEPSESSAAYTTPLNISTTTVLRAAAFKPNFIPTNTDTNTYIFPAAVVTSPVMNPTITQDPTYGPQMIAALTDVPSVAITTPATIVDNASVGCSLEYIPVTGAGVQENAGVELFGGAFTNFQKKSFRLAFKSEFGAAKIEIPGLFANHAHGWKPVEAFDSLELRSGSHDMAMRGFYMSNIFTDGTMLDAGNLNPHGRFVHLYLNGLYWGLYHLRERWDADNHAAYLGGPEDDHEAINGNYNVGGWADPGAPFDGDGSSWARIKSLRGNYPGIRPFLDVPHYIDYELMFGFGTSEDEYRSAGPKDAGSGFKFLLNDADGYLATASYRPSVTTNRFALHSDTSVGRKNGDGPGAIFRQLWVAGNADYRMLLADRIHKLFFNNGPLTPAANQARLSAMCAEIQRAFYAESARWLSSGQSRTPATWASERDQTLNSWFPGRTATVISQLQTLGYYPSVAAPAFGGGAVASGTVVDFPVSGATVYYTTDGSDPRLAGGAVNPAAFTGTSTTLTENTWLRARALSGGTWSALNEAFYSTTAPLSAGDVVFSEIHFNPQGDDDTEFIELWNPTSHAVNLRGAKFTAGIRYDFADNRDIPLAPGGRVVLVASQYNFQKRYGLTPPVAGVYFDRLGNDGDTLTLANAAGTPLISLNYQDLAPWPDSADGDGYSLILADTANPTAASSYRSSIASGGNPDSSDSALPFSAAPLADADKDGMNALLEYFLATSDTNGTSGLAAISSGRTPDGRATLTFTRLLGADDLRYDVIVSPDLFTWTAAATRTSHINHGDGTATETWTANTPAARQFIQLRVTKP